MLEKIEEKIFKVAIYIRLSKEDVDRGYDDSESIKNQRTLLNEYVKKLGYNYKLIDTYEDQGYTGTNFNRPGFQRMINDITLGKINMVVTKDLSRLGRDYIETGEYIEKWFPEKNVRYVSVSDGIDTFKNNNGNNDIAPFMAVLNDMYSKDLSKKIRTALHTMQKQGKWVGGKTALGYMKSKDNKNQLVICEKEAEIVRKIFNKAYEGYTLVEICDYLNKNNIPTTNQIRYNKNTLWATKTIKNILINPVYIGTTIQNKRSRINYKNRRIIINPKDEWNVVKNTHEPIIEKNIFYAVQKLKISQQYLRTEKKHYFLLDGLLVCYECKHKIGIIKRKKGKSNMTCNYYRRNSKLKLCTSHGFNYEDLEDDVLNYIRNLFLKIDSNEIEENIKNGQKKCDYKKLLKKIELEINSLKNNIDNIYLDKLNGKISEEMYNRVFIKLKNDIQKKEKEYDELSNIKEDDKENNIDEIHKIVKEFLKLEKPTPEIMRVIINRIEVHQDKQIDIIFNFKELNDLSI